MLEQFTDPENVQYSPFGTVILFIGFVYAGLILLVAQPSIDIPWWVWFLGIPVVVIGYILEISTKRVLWIRLYQVGIGFLIIAPNLTLLWLFLAAGEHWPIKLLTLLMLLCILGGAAMMMHRVTLRFINLRLMPHGPNGLLNTKTGIVDPKHSPKHIERQRKEADSKVQQISQLSPLIAGISIFLIQMLSEPGMKVMLSAIALLGIFLGMMGTVGYARYVFSILDWEEKHGKHICVGR